MDSTNFEGRDTKEVIIKGKKIKIVFAEKGNPDAIEEVKRILAESYIELSKELGAQIAY